MRLQREHSESMLEESSTGLPSTGRLLNVYTLNNSSQEFCPMIRVSDPQKSSPLCKVLKRLGYANQNHVRLYGDDLLLVDDPMEMTANLVFIDAIQAKTGRHVRIPLNIFNMANQQLPA